jgi:hypothetical protein
MKKLSGGIASIFLLVFLICLQTVVSGQDSVVSSHSETVTTTTTTTTDWYAQPWVWVVGAAVFIIILVALFRGIQARILKSQEAVQL